MMSKSMALRMVGGMALSLALAACSGGASPTSAAASINVVGLDTFKFEPAALSAKAGQEVTVNLENKGNLDHSFIIDELGVKLEAVTAGTTGRVTFTPSTAGTYTFYCDVPGHQAAGMVGTITINP